MPNELAAFGLLIICLIAWAVAMGRIATVRLRDR